MRRVTTAGGANAYEFTEWTAVADLKNRTYSIRSFKNPGVLTVDFKSFDLNGKAAASTPLLKQRSKPERKATPPPERHWTA